MRRHILSTVLLCIAIPASAQIQDSSFVVNLPVGEQRLFQHPNGPFAVLCFDEDAVGRYIGVIFYDTAGNRDVGAWNLSDRFWQDATWGTDVINFAWGTDGRHLFVATSEIYGSGAVYQLDLMQRRVKVLFPSALHPEPEFSGLRSSRIIEVTPLTAKALVWDESDPTMRVVLEFPISE